MSQSAEIKEISLGELIDFFRVKTDSMSTASSADYRKAVTCLRNFLSSGADDLTLSQTILEDWMVYMNFQGLTIKTSIHYLDLISSLYGSAVKEGIAVDTDIFSIVKANVKKLKANDWKPVISESDFARLQNITKSAYRQTGNLAVSSDILLFSLVNNAMSFSDIASLKKEDLTMFSEESKEIAERHSDSRRKYIFPLEQTKKTDRQLDNYVTQLVGHLFDLRNIRILGDVQDTIKSYWAYAALRCGAFASNIIGLVGKPAGIPTLSLCTGDHEAKSDRLRGLVSDVFVENPKNWYAMRLRPGVKFEDIEERIPDLGDRIQKPDFFYPCNEIAKRLKKRLVFEQKPILPDIVFFKNRITDVQPLFAKIGDLAWCYTSDGAYASIPRRAMEQFQRAIGKFTPDYEVGPVGSLPLRKGDKVVVVGGPFMGLEGEIQEDTFDQSKVVYRIMLWGENNNIEWRVSDTRMLERQK